MTLLEEREPAPSLALITTFVAIVTALAFGGVWALNNAPAAATNSAQTAPPAPQEGNI